MIVRAGALPCVAGGAELNQLRQRRGERGEGDLTVLFVNVVVITGKLEPDSSWRCSLEGTGAAIQVVPKKITIRY